MKTSLQHLKLLLCVLAVSSTGMYLSSCGDEEKEKTLPVVTTGEVTEITTTSGKGGGEITNDGNSTITASGLVYSSAVSQPTVSDEKVESTTTSGSFTVMMEDLSSGTTYYVRAYATNSVGTAYGEVLDFTTGNAAPVATGVSVAGDAEVNKELTAMYQYDDAEEDAEGETTFQWYVANDATGAGETAIDGATELTYKVLETQQGKYIRIGITPKATTGSLTGTEVKSTFVGAVGEATTLTFTYNGQSVTYGIINSSTGRKWLDRNLGAANVPTAAADFVNAGDFFQWGRLADGHQLVIHGSSATSDVTFVNSKVGPTPSAKVSTDNPGHSNFILVDATLPTDWRDPQNNNLWQGVGGINNPCPSGWRIPTAEEWTAENLANLDDGYSKLKLTSTGRARFSDGGVSATAGFYWSSSVGTTETAYAKCFLLNSSEFLIVEQPRALGMTCRCIKD